MIFSAEDSQKTWTIEKGYDEQGAICTDGAGNFKSCWALLMPETRPDYTRLYE